MSKKGQLASLPPVTRECLSVLHALTARLGRAPTVQEVSSELGLSRNGARRHIEVLIEKGAYKPLPSELTRMQLSCLRAIDALTSRLGRSPSTREVSEEMGKTGSLSRYHIKRLVELGLVTPPEMLLVLRVTDAGKKFL